MRWQGDKRKNLSYIRQMHVSQAAYRHSPADSKESFKVKNTIFCRRCFIILALNTKYLLSLEKNASECELN
ncbi:hypothetical protein NEAUS06_1582 [Nematocida ausubeli]|nr:hypothetical protein NEAUS06_1582 [Nematocida ausubeli]